MEDCVSAGLALEMDFIAGSRWRPRGQNLKRRCTFNKDVWHHREHTQLILSFPLSSSTPKELKKTRYLQIKRSLLLDLTAARDLSGHESILSLIQVLNRDGGSITCST